MGPIQESRAGDLMDSNRRVLAKWRWAAVAGVLLCLGGCASSPALVGPQPPPTASVGEVATGSACGILVLGFIPARTNSRTERAYAEALQGRSATLTDTHIRYSWYAIPFVGLMLCTEVQGKVVS